MLGTTNDGREIAVDVAAVTGTHVCLIGNTGSGKSHTARKLLEDLWGAGVHVVFDPEQEFHTLRQAHPYVIAGGPYADMPRGRPAALARWVIESGTSIVIQFDEHEHLAVQQGFITAFLEALMTLPRALWRPAFLFIDEAHRYAPQDHGPVSRGAIRTLMSQGRKRGFTGILASQALAKLDKRCTGDCNTWFVGRVGQVVDRNTAANNLGFGLRSDEAIGLRTLDPGQFWAYGVAVSKTPVLIKVGLPQTQHLTRGQNWRPEPLAGQRLPNLATGEGRVLGWPLQLGLVAGVVSSLVAAAAWLT